MRVRMWPCHHRSPLTRSVFIAMHRVYRGQCAKCPSFPESSRIQPRAASRTQVVEPEILLNDVHVLEKDSVQQFAPSVYVRPTHSSRRVINV